MMKLSNRIKGREQWKVVLELLRMLRTFTAKEREVWMCYGYYIERRDKTNEL